ncbi:hypothetical protein K1720_02990 [Thermococcus argininiproducens]|uniref:Uncharacterized protein n=1 Tax=Thermococcus argininiproducens TaxID=2866384 RepID=A0A9E7SCU4_9EURY|nr:hypothetical protein [Thermococcus argininiproducens]USH00444.1 hypothetical protein K1720_02990 [Thermococcus argininiproducens]
MQVIVKAPKNIKEKPKTRVVSFRIPVFIEQQIDTLVELGLFKDRTDFLNYAIQKTLFELVDKIVIPPSEEVLDFVLSLEPTFTPSDDEIGEVMKDVEKEVKSKFADPGGDRLKRSRVLRVRRTNGESNESDNGR